jgi:hypothetical protein
MCVECVKGHTCTDTNTHTHTHTHTHVSTHVCAAGDVTAMFFFVSFFSTTTLIYDFVFLCAAGDETARVFRRKGTHAKDVSPHSCPPPSHGRLHVCVCVCVCV